MAEGINTDKVIVNAGGGGEGAGNMAAVIAALGNRNQGNDNAALIAALGQRNEASTLVPLLAALGNRNEDRRHDDGFGFGGSGILGLLAILGLLRGRGGLGGGDDCNENGGKFAILQTLMENGADIRASIPTTALETQNALQGALAQLALGTAQGFERTGDRIQNSTFLLTKQICETDKNVSEQGCKTREVVQEGVTTILSRIDQNRIAELEAQVARLHGHDHTRDSEIRMTQIVNQNQQQQQQQRLDDDRYARLFGIVANIGNQVQRTRTDQDIVNLGTMAGSGLQSAPNTQVR